jgi:glycosyltransferase involved in cell wall biosynthesis
LSKLLISKGIQVIVLTEGKSSSKDKDLEVIGRESSNLWDNLSSPEEYIDQARMFKEWAAERLYQFADRDYIVHIQDSHFGDLARVAKQVGYRNVIITFHHLVLELFFSVAGRQKKKVTLSEGLSAFLRLAGFASFPYARACLTNLLFSSRLDKILKTKANFDLASAEYHGLKWADTVTVPSPSMKTWLSLAYNGLIPSHEIMRKVQLVPNTIIAPRLHGIRKSNAILSISRIAPQKGIEYLLDAFKIISKNHGDTELWLAGTVSGQFKEYGEFVLRKGQEMGNVLWLGKLSEEEKWIRMSSAQIFALPSVYEALPLTALEAMSVGTPVVSFANDGSQFLLSGGGGIVVRKRNAKSLAKAIMFLLENEERMREMGIKAKQVFEKQFSNDKFIDRIRAIYEMGASPVLKSVS